MRVEISYPKPICASVLLNPASSGGFMKKKLIPSSDLVRSCQNSKQGWEDPGGSAKKEEEGNQLKKSTITGKVSTACLKALFPLHCQGTA